MGVKRDGVSERNLFSRGGFRAAVGTESGVRTVGKRKDLRLGVTPENPLLLTQGIVDARIVLINVAAGAVTGCVVSGTATGQVRERIVLQKRYRGGVEPGRGNDVAREGRSANGIGSVTSRVPSHAARRCIVNLECRSSVGRSDLGKITAALGSCGNIPLERAPLAQPKTLIAAEVEQLVLENRSSDVAPKLVLRKGRARDTISVVEEVIGVQHLVAYEFVERTMDLVGSRLGRKVDDSAGKPAVLWPQVVGLHLEFLDGVLGRNNGNYIQVRSIRRYTINQNLALPDWPPPI